MQRVPGVPGLHEGEAVKVFDCFSGFGGDPAHADHGGWGNAARARGHEVVTLDYEARFNADIVADIREVTAADLPWRPDVVLASPPCEAFSVARIGVNWNHDHTPKTDRARLGLEILEAFMRLLNDLAPTFYVIENPDGKMKRMPAVAHLERRDVTYCKFGMPYKKRTNLWGGFPPSLELPPPCDTNKRPQQFATMPNGQTWVIDQTTGEPCHERAERGAKTGIQGLKDAADRAIIPGKLAEMILEACEHDIGEQAPPPPGRLFA